MKLPLAAAVACGVALGAESLPLEGIAEVGFRVSDLDKARAFYSGVLGLPVAFSAGGSTWLFVNNQQFVVLGPGLPAGENIRLTHIALETTDARSLHRQLAARGLKTPAPVWRGGNIQFSVAEPEGARIDFIQYFSGSPQARLRGKRLGEAQISDHLQHTGVLVRRERLDASLHFWRDQLGFTEFWRYEPAPGDLRLIKLLSPGSRRDIVELMIYTGSLTRERIGSMNHINFAVPDIHAAHRFVLARGAGASYGLLPGVNAEDIWAMNLIDPDGSRIEIQDLTKIPPAVIRDEKIHNRDAWVLDNGWMRVAVLRGGGHLAEIRLISNDPKVALNPMRVPHYPTIDPHTFDPARHEAFYGNTPHRWLSAGYMGHLLCFPFYGPPSEEEIEAGLGNHGEAPISEWKKVNVAQRADGATLHYTADLPKTHYRVERTVTLPRGLRLARVEEWVENLEPYDRPFQWMQHATFGPPFVEPGKTMLDVSATRGLTATGRPGAGTLAANSPLAWPRGTAADGRGLDLRVFQARPSTSLYYALLVDSRRQHHFFALYHPGWRVLIGYVFPSESNPWLADWQENRSNTQQPWNGEVIARGIEFGNSPFAEGLRKAVERGSLFDVPAFQWIGARQKRKTAFTVFLQEIPENFAGVRDVKFEHGIPVVIPR